MAHFGKEAHRWWKESVIYQIYPASFKASDDREGEWAGWGNVKGIISKVPYLKELGVDVVWTSPIYRSPQADMGYDIADYKDIDPRYGTLEDVDLLIKTLHEHDMKLMMDLVVNHTSHEHAWFLESAKSKDNPKRDWYIWKPPKSISDDGIPEPPNNWAQILGDANSAWTYDKQTGEFYLSLFTPEQPDLNWENPEVREAVHDVMHFWLKRGCSGFRMDVINMISKVQTFPDADITIPTQKYQPGEKYYCNGPRMHEYLKGLHHHVLSKYDTITVGEMPFISDINEIIQTVGAKAEELNMIFIFDIVDIDNDKSSGTKFSLYDWPLRDMKDIVTKWQRAMIDNDGWNSLFVENHDQPRSVSRYCDDSDDHRDKGAKLLALLQTTLSGTLFIYQGEEIGMRNVPKSWPVETEYKDIEALNLWSKYKSAYPNDTKKLDECKTILQRKARDNARTPVQWTSASPNAGFCRPDVKPWMRVNDDYRTVNAEASQKGTSDHNHLSVWQFWHHRLRHRSLHKDAFVYGDYEELEHAHDHVFAYLRKSGRTADDRKTFIVVLNWSGEDGVVWRVPDTLRVSEWVDGNYGGEVDGGVKEVKLRAWEGVLGRVE